MGKRRKPKRSRKESRRHVASDRHISGAAMQALARVATSDPRDLRENLARWLEVSAELRAEDEFADYYLDPGPVLDAAVRRFPRFSRRVKRRARVGLMSGAPVYDDYRIAVLGDLDTPALRLELKERVDRCSARLMYGEEEAKIESALVLSMLLDAEAGRVLRGGKKLPLGIIGLVTVVYEESFDRAMETQPGARTIVGEELYDVWCYRHREEDMAQIDAALDGLDSFSALTSYLEGDSALTYGWNRQQDHWLARLWKPESELFGLYPHFFSAAEVTLMMDRMEKRHWSKPWHVSRYLLIPATLQMLFCISETVDEVMTRERLDALVAAFEAKGQAMLDSRDEQMRRLVPALQAGIQELQRTERFSESIVLRWLFLQELIERLQEADGLSPRWQRFTQRILKSRMIARMIREG